MALATRAHDGHPGGDEQDMAKEEARPSGGERAEPLGANTEIGRKLKQYYDELVTEDVPDRFTELLRQLEKRETSSSRREG